MEYNEILDKIKNEKSLGNINDKLFWYIGLIQSIQLFSQKLNFEQVVYACMDCINELLTVKDSAIFVKQDEKYILKKKRGYESCITEIDESEKLKELPVFHAGLLYHDTSKKYFDDKLMDGMNVKIVLPLIVEYTLFGFILIGDKIEGDYDDENYVLAEALMHLFNNALENHKKYIDIQKMNKELDEKVFNLFAINQSSKVLLSELDMYKLCTLAVDVFSELTQSSITSFIVRDKDSGNYILKSYRNVFNVNEKIGMVVRYNRQAQIEPYRVILNAENKEDTEYLKKLFPDLEDMVEKLKAKYIVLLFNKNELFGVVTLGTNIMGQDYRKSIFELIESLATATYIAISNAELFEEINRQNELIKRKEQEIKLATNYAEHFKSDLKLSIEEANRLHLNLEVAYIALNEKFSFEQKSYIEVLNNKFGKVYPVSWNNIFVITNSKNYNIEDDIKEFITGDIQVERYRLNQEFSSDDDFIKLF